MKDSMVRRLTLHGMLLQAVYWFGFSAYMAFMVTTLIDHGWSDGAAAGMMTAMSVIIMLSQPVFGLIGDKYFSVKKLVVVVLGLTVVSLLLLPLSLRSQSKLPVLLNMIGITLTGTQVAGLMDAWFVGLRQEFPSINYGMIRGSGSLTYALSAQLMGMVTITFGHGMRIWLGSGFILLAVLTAATFRPTRSVHQTNADIDPNGKLKGVEAFRLIFSSKPYCLLLVVSFFLLLSNAAMPTLIQLSIRNFGGTAAQIGTASALGAASEVPGMFLMAYIMTKIKQKKLLLISGAIYALRMLITASVGTIHGMIYVQLMQGITYAVLLPVSISYLSEIVDERVRTTAVTTYTAITASLTGILGNLITSAFLTKGLSAQHALIFFAFSAMLGFAIALYGSIRNIWDADRPNRTLSHIPTVQ
jgi:PPP family 3-phenylpropionic acid transporter